MPLEHDSSGVAVFFSDDEVNNVEQFHNVFRIKWERIQRDTASYKRQPLRAVVNRIEGGYRVDLYSPLRHRKPGVTVNQTAAAIYGEIIRQHGEALQ